jgi:hypothetical protein
MADLEGLFVNVKIVMHMGTDEQGEHMLTAIEHSPELTPKGVIDILRYAAAGLEREEAEDDG